MPPRLSKTWNQPVVAALHTSSNRTGPKLVVKYSLYPLIVAVLCVTAGLSGWHLTLSSLIHSLLRYVLVIAAYTAAAVCGLAGLMVMRHIPQSFRTPQWVSALTAQQRSLLGLPNAPQRPVAPAATQPSAGQATRMTGRDIAPPKRTLVIAASPLGAATGTAGSGWAGTPDSAGLGMRRRDFYASAVSPSPQRWQALLDEFDKDTQPATPSASAAADAGAVFGSPMLAPTGAYAAGSPVGDPLDYMLGRGSLGPGASPLLSHTPPQYHPSPKPHTVTPSGATQGALGTPAAAAPEAVAPDISIQRRVLEARVDRLRVWFSTTVLKTLVKRWQAAPGEVQKTAAALGWTVEVASLEAQADRQSLSGSNNAATREEADADMLLSQMREQLLHRLRTQPHVQPQETMACLQAVHAYQKLAALLRGELPRNLLPPVSRGYVVTRVRQLLASTCIKDFQWDGGGTFQGRPWTPELPSDSALLLFLFAAFLEAPGWQYSVQEPATSLPLYLGQLPAVPVNGYYAILANRPPKDAPKASAAVVGLGLGTASPQFLLLTDGRTVTTDPGPSQLFTTIVLFLRHVEEHGGGEISGRSLLLLGLSPVVRAVGRSFHLLHQWFGIW